MVKQCIGALGAGQCSDCFMLNETRNFADDPNCLNTKRSISEFPDDGMLLFAAGACDAMNLRISADLFVIYQ